MIHIVFYIVILDDTGLRLDQFYHFIHQPTLNNP